MSKPTSSSLLRKKKQSPRNPLKDLNSTSAEEIKRGGCFRFFTPTPSSSSSKDSISRSSQTTPRILPISKNPTHPSKFQRKTLKTSSENPRLPKTLKPAKNRTRPSSKDGILGSGHSSEGKIPHLNPNPSKHGGSLAEMLPGSCSNSAPEKTLFRCRPQQMGLEASTTPNTTTTPPIQTSISPEIAAGSNVDPTPTCFAAGYIVAGVHDRRKCRPRGILTVGESGQERSGSRSMIASLPPPIADASIQWISSPSGGFNSTSEAPLSHFRNEASVNWFVSPHCDGEGARGKVSPFSGIRESSDHDFWGFSPTNSNTSRSPVLRGLLGSKSPDLETTPSSSGNVIRATPTSGSSVSPFSAIVQRANTTSSGFRFIRPYQEENEYRYGKAFLTPSPYSSSRRISELDSAAEFLGALGLSSQTDASDLPLSLPATSFQVGCPATPSNSVDLACFKKQESDEARGSPLKDNSLRSSELRISWRDGLVSRIFEMGDFDCCTWTSDDEDNVNFLGEDKDVSRFGCKFKSKNKNSALNAQNKDNRGTVANDLGSFEFPCGRAGVQKCEAEFPISCAESLSMESGGLISSSDSDWTFSYRNHLFENER